MTDDTQPPAPAGEPAPQHVTYTLGRGDGSVVTLTAEIAAERVERRTERVFQKRVRQANIPGFRPGKAPRAIYERTYGADHLWHEAAEESVDETYREIVQHEGLEPLDRPTVEVSDPVMGEPVRYTATFPVRPEVTLGEYADHGIAVEPTPVTDEDVEKTIDGLRERHAELRPVERAAADGDVVTVDVDVEIEGRRSTVGRGAHLEIGREHGLPGLSDGLRGASAGEQRTLELAIPQEHPDEALRGKTGRFEVTVSAVAEKILPERDDAFAKTVGLGGAAELERAVRGELAHASFHRARDDAAERLMEHVLGRSEVVVPEILIEDELDHLVAELRDRVTAQGGSLEQFLLQARRTEEDLRAEWRPAAERRAKALLVLDALAKRENVTISGSELAQEVAGTPIAQDPQALRDPAVLASLARSLRNRKVVDKLIGLAEPDAERALMRRAGAPANELDEPATPSLVVPDAAPTHSAEDREAIREMLRR